MRRAWFRSCRAKVCVTHRIARAGRDITTSRSSRHATIRWPSESHHHGADHSQLPPEARRRSRRQSPRHDGLRYLGLLALTVAARSGPAGGGHGLTLRPERPHVPSLPVANPEADLEGSEPGRVDVEGDGGAAPGPFLLPVGDFLDEHRPRFPRTTRPSTGYYGRPLPTGPERGSRPHRSAHACRWGRHEHPRCPAGRNGALSSA
jgi:hypothetical protein